MEGIMAGIFGVYKKDKGVDLDVTIEAMIRSMDSKNKLKVDKYRDDELGIGIGRVSLGIFNQVDQPVKEEEENYLLIFHGELYGDTTASNTPQYILKKYIKEGDRCFADLCGIFHLAIYDKKLGKLKLVIDKFGLQPLYYSIVSGSLIFGGEVKALLEDKRVNRTPDYRAFADFLRYGHILGEKTLFTNIKTLASGSVLTFDLSTGDSTINKYWDLRNCFVEGGNYDYKASVDKVVSLLIKSIRDRLSNKESIGLSLSGGLDSRGILAGCGEDAHGIRTYTLGLAGCGDEKLAQMMSQLSGTNHEFIELGQEYGQNFEKMAKDMIFLSDGMYHPHESTEMAALEYFKRAGFKILLRGHGGETAKAALAYPVMVAPEVYTFTGKKDILNFIFNNTNLVIRDIDSSKLFKDTFYEIMKESPRKSLEESCGVISDILAPADVCIYYYINEYIRRQVIASLEIFRTQVEIRLPYIDETYMHALLKLPVKLRNSGEIHFELIKRCMPGLIKIPNSNTGAPLDAGRIRLYFTDKFHSIMKKLSITGFRHYTEFQKWHREGFRKSSHEIIFSDKTAARGLYNMDYLEFVFNQHVKGEKNYGHILGTIVGIELWYRTFVD